jgi:tetrathionate reductase subunit B
MKMDKPDVSRRDFVRSIGAGAAVATAAGTVPISAGAAYRREKTHFAMVIDVRRCSGCHACSVSCKSEFNVPLGGARSWVEYIDKGTYPNVSRGFLPRMCNHCSEPPCVPVCPVDATYKLPENDIVFVDQDECIGCRRCVKACPYDARFMNPAAGDPEKTKNGAAEKCDFCFHRAAQGVMPSCVNTCQGRARIFGDRNDPTSEVAHLIAEHDVTVLKAEEHTVPNVYYIGLEERIESDAAFTGQFVRVTTHRNEELWPGEPTQRRGEGRR